MRSTAIRTDRLRIAAVLAAAALAPVAHAGPPTGHAKPRPTSQPLVVRGGDGGFRWGDAGIGAAAGFGGALVLAGSLALTGRRDQVVHYPRHRRDQP